MKRIALFTTLALLATLAQARVISPKRAMQIAERFPRNAVNGKTPKAGTMRVAYTALTGSNPDFYAINHNDGFVIVTADDVIGEKVLGYSDSGQFDYSTLPDNARWWLSQYQEQIESVRRNGATARSVKYITNTGGRDIVVPPLLGDILWDQGSPYNDTCPLINGEHAKTGCVATAMAEIMYFHSWPLIGTGEKQYTYRCNTYYANFGNTPIEWNRIYPRYDDAISIADSQPISSLMSECGIAVSMQYGLDASSAFESSVPSAIKSYFDYESTAKSVSSNGCSPAEWTSMLKNELDAYRPILYCGASSKERHAFVCDGYTADDYFHFNFGWTGLGNGYYLSNVAGEYSKSQTIVCGIQPKGLANRRKADGIVYNIIAEGEVSVAYPDSKADYAGDIVIPETVDIDGTTYTVTRIGNAAFANCRDLQSLTLPASVSQLGGNAFFGCSGLTIKVPWQTPLKVYGTTFDTDLASAATLIVPEGAVEAYTTATGWMLFSDIRDQNGNSSEWGEWTDFISGKGSYAYLNLFSSDIESKDLPVKIRASKTDSNQCQVMVANWGINTGNSLIFDFNRQTGQCVIPRQPLGFYQPGIGLMNISDMPSYADKYTYSQWPSKYDADNGVFTFSVSYYLDDGRYWTGTDTLTMSLGEGDLNVDGSTDQADLQTLSDYILGRNPTPFRKSAADIDHDGIIDVADVSQLANYILNHGK